MNEDEPPHLCAVREVLEETGYDMSAKIDPDEYILKEISGQRCCLYMVRNSYLALSVKSLLLMQYFIYCLHYFPMKTQPHKE